MYSQQVITAFCISLRNSKLSILASLFTHATKRFTYYATYPAELTRRPSTTIAQVYHHKIKVSVAIRSNSYYLRAADSDKATLMSYQLIELATRALTLVGLCPRNTATAQLYDLL